MADGWYYNGIRIYVTEIRDDQEQIIAELNPISASTVYHLFGYTKPKLSIKAVVVGSGTKAQLENLRTTATAYTLSGEFSTWNYLFSFTGYPGTMGWTHRRGVSQTIDPSKGLYADVYDLEMEILGTND